MTATPPDQHREPYRDRRDDDELWRALRPESEPTAQRWFLPLVVAAVVLGAPWYLPAELATRSIEGLPVWVWVSLGSALALASVSSFAALRHWRDDDR